MKLESIFDASIPLIVLILLGYLCSLFGLIDCKYYQPLIQFVIKSCLPLTMFYNLTFQSLGVQDLVIIFSYLAGIIALTPFVYLLAAFYKQRRMAFAQIFSSANISNILLSGIQLTSAFYDSGLTEKYAYVQSFGQCLFQIPLSIIVYDFQSQGKENIRQTIKTVCLNTIKSPLVISVLLALIANIFCALVVPGVKPPIYVAELFKQFSSLTSTTGIVCIGMFIHQLTKSSGRYKQNGWLVLLKFTLQGALKSFVLPLVVMFCMKIVDMDKESVKINVSLSACHSGVMTFAQASQYDVEQLVAGLMVAAGLVWTIVYTIAFDKIVELLW